MIYANRYIEDETVMFQFISNISIAVLKVYAYWYNVNSVIYLINLVYYYPTTNFSNKKTFLQYFL